MAVTKRTRFEVLKRDNNTCRYCHETDSALTVDHVVPVALGGSDKPDNLVAACKDCNAGKSSTTVAAELVQQVGEDDIRWAAAIKRAADVMRQETEANKSRNNWFLSSWEGWDETQVFLPSGWSKSVDHWTGAGLPNEVLLECLGIALGNRNVSASDVFAYMGGIARKRIEELHDAAKKLIDDESEASNG